MIIHNQSEHKYDVFISYAKADQGWAKKYLIDALEQTEVRWHSEDEFNPGTPYLTEFEAAVKYSKRILVVLTPAYQVESIANFLSVLGQSYGLETNTWPVIPLILKPVKLPLRLSQLVSLDFSNQESWDSELERLVTLLQKKLPPSENPRCPYPGLKTFSTDDSHQFFGRDDEIRTLARALRLHPFQAVIGPSGSGKSSLVLAGLIPALRKNKFFNAGEWNVKVLRPGSNPVSTLEDVLSGTTDKTFQDSRGTRILLVVDQLEELFTLVENSIESEAFQKKLLELIEEQSIIVVITVRAYFYNKLMRSCLWPQIKKHRLELLPLDEEGLRQAIVGPAEMAGAHVEVALVERLVADASGEPGILPFVQETLVSLWHEGLRRRYLPLHAYESLVLPRQVYGDQTVTGLYVALTEHADNTYKNLSVEEQKIAKRIFLRLVQFGEGREHTRRQIRIKDLIVDKQEQHLFEQTLSSLVEARLITKLSYEEDPVGYVDLAHEVLIGGWPQLKEWVNKYHPIEQERRDLIFREKNWSSNKKQAGFLDETELHMTSAWLKKAELVGMEVDFKIVEFIESSRKKALKQKLKSWARPAIAALLVALISASSFYGYRFFLKHQAISASPMIALAGGEFSVGLNSDKAMAIEKKSRKIHVKDFYLERFEVSNEKYKYCVKAGQCKPPTLLLEKYSSIDYKNHPIVGITPVQAATYCQWLSRRLPTSVEWEMAAKAFPQQSLELPKSKNHPDAVSVSSGAEEGKDDILHLMGNVWEWVIRSDDACADKNCQILPWDKKSNIVTAMGGSYRSRIERVDYMIPLGGIEAREPDFGFRCGSTS